MRRILIVGCSGAGKTTLAKALGEVLNIPVHYLDRYFWSRGWIEKPKEEFDAELAEILRLDSWIIDGNYGRTFPERLKYADTVIFLRYSRWLCLYRVFKRFWKYRGKTRPDMGEGCLERLNFEFLRYIWNYNVRMLPRMTEYLKEASAGCKIRIFNDPAGTETFLRCLIKDKQGAE